MKILYLTPGVFDKGGISRYTRFQIQALRELIGEENLIVLSLLGPKGSENDFEESFMTNWHGNTNGNLFFQIVKFSIISFIYSLKNKPDIIWSGHLNYSGLIYALSTLFNSKSVVQIYGREVWTPRKFRPDINWGFENCDHIISDCHFTANYVDQTKSLSNKISVIWDCVDIYKFFPKDPSMEILSKYGIPQHRLSFNILTLGRISKSSEYKGYERLLNLFTNIDKKANLIFGGNGDLLDKLRQKAIDLGVSNRVFFTGFIDDEDLPDVYRSASIFSLIGDRGIGRGEGIPLTPLEAAACGIPILVGNQDGSKEAVIQGENGFAFNPFDLDEITKKINILINNKKLIQKMGQNARKRILIEHSYEVFKHNIENFIKSIVLI